MIINVKYQLLSRDSNGMFQVFLNYPKISPITNLLNMADKIAEDLTIAPTEEIQKTETEKKEEKKEPENKTEETKPQSQVPNQVPNPLGQINPLLLNPNLNPMMNQNLPNLQNPLGNMMLAMMMQQAQAANQANQATSNIKGDVSSSSALKELKELVNKYKSVMSVEDKNRMDFLIDSLGKKI